MNPAQNRFIFNFTFNRQSDGRNYTGVTDLRCGGYFDYTLGNYQKNEKTGGTYIARSYIFLKGNGVPSFNEEKECATESEARKWLIEKAVQNILKLRPEDIPATIHEIK